MKRMGLLSLAMAAALTMACSGTAPNDNGNNGAVGTSGVADRNNGSPADRSFVQDMLADGDAEIQLGKMAEQRAASPEVKRFGRMMVEDHTKAGDQLKKIAAEYNIAPDPDNSNHHKDLIDKLSKLNGRDFDREYISAMVDDHQDAVDSLKKHVDTDNDHAKGTTGSGQHPAVDTNARPAKADDHVDYSINQWSAMTLPVVEHHLDDAKQIQDRMHRTARHRLGKAKT